MYFTSGSDRAFEQLMQGKPGFDHYDSGEAVTPEDCGTCRFYRPHWKYQFCVYAECPYQPGKLTAYDAVTFRVKGVENMAVFRVERNKGYTVMSNHHLRNKDLSLKAKGLLRWATWVCSPACCSVRIAAERCTCAEPITSNLNRNITFAQLTVKTALYVRPILSGALSLKKSCCETCEKPFSM